MTRRDGKNIPLEVHSYVSMLKNESGKAYTVQEAVPIEIGQRVTDANQPRRETSAQGTASAISEKISLNKNKDVDDITSNRLRACAEAKVILARSAGLGMKIEDFDVLRCLQLWGFKKNVNRSNVWPGGIDHVTSDTLGVIQIPCTRETILSPSSSRFPAFTKLIATWFSQHLPAEAR